MSENRVVVVRLLLLVKNTMCLKHVVEVPSMADWLVLSEGLSDKVTAEYNKLFKVQAQF